MKMTTRFAALVLATGFLFAPAAVFAQGPPPGAGWDAPPSDFTRDIQRRGFRDGLNGARHDFENRRRPDVMNRDEFRHYRGPEPRLYRDAFQRGYNAYWQHMGPGGRY